MLDSRTPIRVIHFLLLLAVLCGSAHPQGRPTLEGNRPYTPTRLEWLAVELNAQLRGDLSESIGYLMQFVPIGNANTIMINVVVSSLCESGGHEYDHRHSEEGNSHGDEIPWLVVVAQGHGAG
jgi:hypothetical protein